MCSKFQSLNQKTGSKCVTDLKRGETVQVTILKLQIKYQLICMYRSLEIFDENFVLLNAFKMSIIVSANRKCATDLKRGYTVQVTVLKRQTKYQINCTYRSWEIFDKNVSDVWDGQGKTECPYKNGSKTKKTWILLKRKKMTDRSNGTTPWGCIANIKWLRLIVAKKTVTKMFAPKNVQVSLLTIFVFGCSSTSSCLLKTYLQAKSAITPGLL